jgi:hypothetical protein
MGDTRFCGRRVETGLVRDACSVGFGHGVIAEVSFMASATPIPKDVVHYWDDVRDVLARSRAGGEDIVASRASSLNRVGLMLIQSETLAGSCVLPDAKDGGTIGVHGAVGNQAVNCARKAE